MSRTYRRRGERHEYHWVLREVTMRSGVPHWFCRIFKRRQRNADTRELLRWLVDPSYDPVMQSRHRHSANWAW